MPRYSYGDDLKDRVWNLLEALLSQVNAELEGRAAVEDVLLKPSWPKGNNNRPTLEVKAQLTHLSKLSKGKLSIDDVRDVLRHYLLEFLGILEDKRKRKQGKGSENWHFILTLWSTELQENQKEFNTAWKCKKSRETKISDVSPSGIANENWRNICRTMLEKQKQLTTNRLMRADEMLFNIDRISVDLALVKRKQIDKRSEDDNPARSQLYKPDYEEIQKLEYKEFLSKVLKSEQSKKIAIIGEPGAGKMTLLQRIAFWILENTDDLPIWIPLGNFPNPAPKFKDYLLNDWLEDAIFSVTPKVRAEFEQLLMAEKVWLLLDGVDEMAAKSGSPLTVIANRIVGWCSCLRVVLTCRLNAWEANPYSLNGFQTYSTLEFSEEKVEEFINACFQNRRGDTCVAPTLGIQLQQALNQPGKERIKDLVKNPLRLTLLCSTWHLREGKLPDTKAELYQQFVEEVYRWQDKEKEVSTITPEEREQLNAKLKELAVAAIDNETNRFCLRQKFVESVFQDSSLFQLALDVGWLNQVGVDAKNPNQRVYAFFHPTFQEYFAALAIADWDFFLPRAHDNDNPKPVSERYRIFESQWQEPILFWLGRKDLGDQPSELIEKLINFQDGCGSFSDLENIGRNFYSYRAYFLVGMGTSEVGQYFKNEEIIKQLIEWISGKNINTEEKCMVSFLRPISDEAYKTLFRSELSVAIHLLKKLVKETESACLSLRNSSKKNYSKKLSQLSVKYQYLTQTLGNIANFDNKSIETIINLINSSKDKEELWLSQLIQALGLIEKTNTSASETLTSLIRHHSCKIRHKAAFSLGKIDKANKEAVQILVDLFEDSKNEEGTSIINSLRELAEANNEYALKALRFLSSKYANDLYLKLQLEILQSENKDNYSKESDLSNTQKYLSKKINRIEETLSKINSSVDSSERFHLIDCLKDSVLKIGQLGQGNSEAIITLLKIIQDPALGNSHFSGRALEDILEKEKMGLIVTTLKVHVLPKNHEQDIFYDCYELIWHCAQNMTYPDFYQAWHQQEEVDNIATPNSQSLNHANLPQSLQSAIANDPQLSPMIHLICIDSSKFIDPNNPAAKIYTEMVKRGCPKCNDGTPKTMAELQIYWDLLEIEFDKRIVLVFYSSSADTTSAKDTAMPCPYSETFLSDLSKFGDRICVITHPPFNHIPLKFFTPSHAVEDMKDWLQTID